MSREETANRIIAACRVTRAAMELAANVAHPDGQPLAPELSVSTAVHEILMERLQLPSGDGQQLEAVYEVPVRRYSDMVPGAWHISLFRGLEKLR